MSAVAPPAVLMQSAQAQAQLIASRQLSCKELMRATLGWIERANPVVNAICTLAQEQALAGAVAADQRLAAGAPARPLEGLPMAIKDLAETKDLRTTYGSPLFAEYIPNFSVLYVQRLQAAGAVLIGKTNVPEFGAGSQTFNPLFGATATPYGKHCTAGGSSGGAAAALAARMVALADGSDLGGSLRNPAAFCNVVGFRPSPGRVPTVPDKDLYNPLPTAGPMARSVADVGLLLSVMAGPDERAPLSIQEPGSCFTELSAATLKGARVAYSEDLGMLPVVAEIRAAVQAAATQFTGLGATVQAAHPDLSSARDVFQTLRAQMFVAGFGSLYRTQPESLKDTMRWNIELGLSATPEQIGQAQQGMSRLRTRMLEFFESWELLLLPTTQVLPFAKHIDWPRQVDGVRQHNYLDWMASCWLLSVTGCPAISMPCGFSETGLPIGLQIVGPPGADLRVLQAALAYEQVTDFAAQSPDWQRLFASA